MLTNLTTPPPRTNAVDEYARAVVAGDIVAGKYHRLACARHVADRAREATPGFPFRFEIDRAARFFRFAEYLQHYKGEWAGRPIRLEPHQKFRLGSVFGWVHIDTGLRRYRTAYNEIPRKNGKSLEAAVVALYVAFFDDEPGAEGYVIATKRDQAKIVWTDASRLVKASPYLRSRIKVLAANLHRDAYAQKLEPLGADKDSTDGLNPHLIVVDEFHALKARGLLDVMETATGARRQPVNYQITTAGDDPMSPCGDQHDYATKILDGVLTDETFFAFIAHADPEDLAGDGWLSEAAARKANPNYGVSINQADLVALATKARFMPSAAAAYQQKRLNVWINTTAPWLSLEGWRAGQTTWTPADLYGRACCLGVDLSSKIDLTAVVAMFPPTAPDRVWRMVSWVLTPDDTLDDRELRDRAPYRAWQRAGHLDTCPGQRIDQDRVVDMVADAAARYRVQFVGVDPWNAGTIVALLTARGIPTVEVPQTVAQMSAPCKDFEADVLDGLVDAGGNPLVQWAASNVVVLRDAKDNIFPTKKKSRGRIDPIVAAIIARKLAAAPPAVEAPKQFQMFVMGGAHA